MGQAHFLDRKTDGGREEMKTLKSASGEAK